MAVDTTIQVVMPRMGDSVAEGTVLEWRKGEGETVSADETIVEISTDKVDAEVAAPAAGTLVKILAAEGETVTAGSVLAEIAANGSPAAEAPAAPTDGAEAPLNGTVETIDIVTPSAGESVTEGTILEWTVKVGDVVKQGDTVVEISTDKVDVELPAPASGAISELLVVEGDTVTVGQVIGRMLAGGASAKHVLGTTDGILSLRGRWFEWRSADGALELPALPTLHPAFLLRQPAAKKHAWEDLLKLVERLDRPARPT